MERETLQALITAIEEVVNLYYQQKNEEANARLNGLLTQIEQNIENILSTPGTDGTYIHRDLMNQILDAAVNAMMEQDTILLADILHFELATRLEELQPE